MAGVLHIPSNSFEPIQVSKHQHLAQAYYTMVASDLTQQLNQSPEVTIRQPKLNPNTLHTQLVTLDPDGQLTDSE